MPITALPTPPQRSDPTNFASRGDAFMTALPTFATEANALATDVNADAATASAAAITATTQAGLASTSASNASTSASTATTQAGIATTQAGIATTQASNALASANAAAASAAVINLTAPGPIGGTTPSTIAATTLSASGQVNASADIKLVTNAFFLKGRNAANTTDIPIVKVNASDVLEFGSGGYSSTFTGPVAVNGNVSMTETNPAVLFNTSAFQVYKQSNDIRIYTESVDRAIFNASGLAVIGALSATGGVKIPTAVPLYLNAGLNSYIQELSAGNIQVVAGGSASANFTSAGIAVTGKVSFGDRGNTYGVHLPDWRIYNTSSGNSLAFNNFTTDVMTLSGTSLAVTGAVTATTTMNTGGYTVATLPAGSVGDRAYVTDATAPTFLGALTGGGAVRTPVFKNASAWVAA